MEWLEDDLYDLDESFELDDLDEDFDSYSEESFYRPISDY